MTIRNPVAFVKNYVRIHIIFGVKGEKQLYYCFNCKRGGDASGIVSNGYTVYVNGNALAGTK